MTENVEDATIGGNQRRILLTHVAAIGCVSELASALVRVRVVVIVGEYVADWGGYIVVDFDPGRGQLDEPYCRVIPEPGEESGRSLLQL